LKNKSKITGKTYEAEDCVFLINALQTFKYLDNGAELVDLICGEKNRLVFVFSKEKTHNLYDKWCKYEL